MDCAGCGKLRCRTVAAAKLRNVAYDQELAQQIRTLLDDEPEASAAIVGGRLMKGWLTIENAALDDDSVMKRRFARGLKTFYEPESKSSGSGW